MDKKLREFNKTNATLGYLVDNLRKRQKHMQAMIKKTRVKIQTNQIVIRTFENAVYWVVQDIDDYEKLKRSISHRLMTYVQDFQSKTQEMNEEIKKEDETQLKYLTSVTANLNQRIAREAQLHTDDHKINMQANRELITDINNLRLDRDAKLRKFKEAGGEKALNFYRDKERKREQLIDSQKDNDHLKSDTFAGESLEVQKEMAKKRQYIQDLERKLKELNQKKLNMQQFGSSGEQWQK